MKELKTLKDLNLGYEGYEPEDENIRQQLREEAVKWFKHFEGDAKEGVPCVWFAMDFIKHFFNLTEEDLK